MTDTDYDTVLALYEQISDDYMDEWGDVPMVLAATCPEEPSGYRTTALSWGDMMGLTDHAYHLHLLTDPPVEHLLLVLPMFYAASINPRDYENLAHGDLEAAYKRGDERVTQALVVFDAAMDQTTMMAYRPPLNEPLISRPTPDGGGPVSDLLRSLHTAMNMPVLD